MELGEKVDKGARVAWYATVTGGVIVSIIGALWFLDTQGIIDINLLSICAILLVIGGIVVIAFGLWLRSLLEL